MPIDAATAMARARDNFKYLAEAKDDAHLAKLKGGACGYNHSLLIAGLISPKQLDQLNRELDEACLAYKSPLA